MAIPKASTLSVAAVAVPQSVSEASSVAGSKSVAISVNERAPDPSVFITCPELPSDVGKASPDAV